MSVRSAGWQDRFWAVIAEAREQPFAWGTHDCVTFAAKCVAAVTGEDTLGKVTGRFGTWSDARAAVRAYGSDLGAAVDEFLGPRVPWTQISIADIAIALDDHGKQLLVVHDGVQLICPDHVGLRSIPFRCALGGWKI